MTVQILGNASGGLYMNRAFSAQIVQHGRHHFLVDCGEGTQMQVYEFGVKLDKIEFIFISHLHGDHVLGLMGILSNFSMQKRTKNLQIFGPAPIRAFLETQIAHLQLYLTYPLLIHEIQTETPELLATFDTIQVSTIPLVHRVPTIGYIFTTIAPKLKNIRPEVIDQYRLSIDQIKAVKEGKNIRQRNGDLIENTSLVLPTAPVCSYAYCSDTAYSEAVIEAVKGVNLLYHEATFLEDQRELAEKTKHSTAKDAALVAQQAGVKKLILGHLSGRFSDFTAHEAEARTIFAESYGSIIGETYQISSGD
jgi:ribonuclease Z